LNLPDSYFVDPLDTAFILKSALEYGFLTESKQVFVAGRVRSDGSSSSGKSSLRDLVFLL